jgi:hypothetical protein
MGNRTSFRRGEFTGGQAAGVAARKEASRIRQGLAERTLSFGALLSGDHELAARADRLQVEQLLRWCPGMGQQRITRTLDEMQLAPTTRVGELDGAHRRALVAVVNAYQPRGER